MTAVLLGLLAAAGLGIADFMARFTARAIGPRLAYALVLLVGVVVTTAALLSIGSTSSWPMSGIALAVVHGFSVTTMCLLLYAGLARGPVAIVAPIVAAHPVLVLAVNILMGTRPSALQWLAMLGVIAGALLIARSAGEHPQFQREGHTEMEGTLSISAGACVAYSVLVLTGQAAAPLVGELETVFIGRWAGLVQIFLLLSISKVRPSLPAGWIPILAAQGLLDTLGYLALIGGANTSSPHVSMVVASTFSVFTVLLARIVLQEPISQMQWAAIGLIAIGTSILAGS